MKRLSSLLVGILLWCPSVWATQNLQTELTAPTSEQTQQLLNSVQRLIDSHYVDEVDRQRLLEGALKGMLEQLDPHSSYLSPQTLSLMRENNRGHYYGYGLEVAVEDQQIRVVTPLAGSSAAAAGVLPGDVLLQVDDLIATPANLEPLIAYIKQSSRNDHTVQLQLQRETMTEPLLLSVAPSTIDIQTSHSELLDPQIGYLKIHAFNQRTAAEVRSAARAFAEQPLQGLVLDLRNNPGGLLNAAVQIVDMFMEEGLIVSTHGRSYDADNDFYASGYALFPQLPVAILINQGSASAAEIVAGALQDHGRATLVGQRSYGKGTVQSLIPLMGQRGAIKLTTARYATPNGTFIDKVGIAPDVTVTFAPDPDNAIVADSIAQNRWTNDPQLLAAYQLLSDP
ncbi:S41 family peptidase [Ferrimonas senticii]|uniref:S41 family peptidase n=1 Tax=Ferrimonas senticii TaxID=394566 RepID=UPI00040F3582|nr:S41 family peptidase [Ferrimonas senticii]